MPILPVTIGIIEFGGTGSYGINLVAKTAVESVHLFDEDAFLQCRQAQNLGQVVQGDLFISSILRDWHSAGNCGML